jgi:hypothetical protein
VVYAASSSAYGPAADPDGLDENTPLRPLSPYAAAKLTGEHYLEAFAASYGLERIAGAPYLVKNNMFGWPQAPVLQSGMMFSDEPGIYIRGEFGIRLEDELLITDKGVLVRTRVAEIRELGRATQGVTLIGLDEGAKLSGLQRIVENDANSATEDDPGTDGPTDSTA